jgi:hypothetical protein
MDEKVQTMKVPEINTLLPILQVLGRELGGMRKTQIRAGANIKSRPTVDNALAYAKKEGLVDNNGPIYHNTNLGYDWCAKRIIARSEKNNFKDIRGVQINTIGYVCNNCRANETLPQFASSSLCLQTDGHLYQEDYDIFLSHMERVESNPALIHETQDILSTYNLDYFQTVRYKKEIEKK